MIIGRATINQCFARRPVKAMVALMVTFMLLVTVPLRAAGPMADSQPSSIDQSATPESPRLSAWELYKRGGWFMYPLTACSVLAVALILERLVALRRRAVNPPGFLRGLREAARDPRANRQAALDYCRAADVPISRILAAGIKRLPRGVAVAEKAMEDAGANEALRLRRNMRFLYAIGSVATLLGLIGTIAGMIVAFQGFQNAGTGAGDVHKLSEGIYGAMVNTFGGLAVAIVVTVFYYYFVSRIERLIGELNETLGEFADDFGFNEPGA